MVCPKSVKKFVLLVSNKSTKITEDIILNNQIKQSQKYTRLYSELVQQNKTIPKQAAIIFAIITHETLGL